MTVISKYSPVNPLTPTLSPQGRGGLGGNPLIPSPPSSGERVRVRGTKRKFLHDGLSAPAVQTRSRVLDARYWIKDSVHPNDWFSLSSIRYQASSISRTRIFLRNQVTGTLIFSTLIFLLLVCVFSHASASSDQQATRVNIEELILRGLDFFFNFEFEEGKKEFDKVIILSPQNPAGYLFKAIGLMANPHSQYKTGHPDQQETNKSVDKLLREAIEKGEKALVGAAKDSQIYLMLATAHAFKSVRALDENSPLKALREAQTGRTYLLQGLELDPQNYDFYYGLGILDYYVGNIKGLYGFLISRIFFKGNKSRGIGELEIAAEKGIYAKHSAKAELFFILVNMEKDFGKAIPLGYELIERFPNNPEFNFLLTYSLSEVKKWDEALNMAAKIGERIDKGKESFWGELIPRHWHLTGKIYLDKGELETARDYLEKAASVKEKDFLWIQSLALARLGMVYDLKHQREKAVEYYEHAREAYENGTGAELAKHYLETPYSR